MKLCVWWLTLAITVSSFTYAQTSLPPCDSQNVSDSALQSAIQQALAEVQDPQDDGRGQAFSRVAEILGCSLVTASNLFIFRDDFESGTLGAWSTGTFTSDQIAAAPPDCRTTYCSPYGAASSAPRVFYCGRENSQIVPSQIHPAVTDALNKVCFEHDHCYRDLCVLDRCAFAGLNSQSGSCDRPMIEFCRSVGSGSSFADRMVCRFAELLPANPFSNRTDCNQVPCLTGTCVPQQGCLGRACTQREDCGGGLCFSDLLLCSPNNGQPVPVVSCNMGTYPIFHWCWQPVSYYPCGEQPSIPRCVGGNPHTSCTHWPAPASCMDSSCLCE